MSSPDTIFQAILHNLLQGRLVPGQRLTETDIAREFGVSRGSVREAFTRLTAEGVVTLKRHRGATIRLLTKEEIHDVLSVMEVIVGLAARLAAEKIDAGDNRRCLKKILGEVLSFEKDSDFLGFVRARNRFYRTLVDIGGNRELERILPTMHTLLVRALVASQTRVEKTRFDDYRRLVQAVLDGDPKQAERTARHHVAKTRRALEQMANTNLAAALAES